MPIEYVTREKADYCYYWSSNSAHYDKQGCYSWMADQLAPLRPARVLDIGCGTGLGLLALLRAYRPAIVSIEENPACIDVSCEALTQAGWSPNPVFRLAYDVHPDGTHDLRSTEDLIRSKAQISIVQGDTLLNDPIITEFLDASARFDAVTIWLIGTFQMRRTCRNLREVGIRNENEYRLHVQNGIYKTASRYLRPGGWLHVVDRGEVPTTEAMKTAIIDSHREQASRTDLEVLSVAFREYQEPTEGGVTMVATRTDDGRIADLSRLAMHSVISQKPS
jgi:SAM-dependent methyltransferase